MSDIQVGSPDSSVGIATNVHAGRSEFRFPGSERGVCLFQNVQTGAVAHLGYYLIGSGCSFPLTSIWCPG